MRDIGSETARPHCVSHAVGRAVFHCARAFRRMPAALRSLANAGVRAEPRLPLSPSSVRVALFCPSRPFRLSRLFRLNRPFLNPASLSETTEKLRFQKKRVRFGADCAESPSFRRNHFRAFGLSGIRHSGIRQSGLARPARPGFPFAHVEWRATDVRGPRHSVVQVVLHNGAFER